MSDLMFVLDQSKPFDGFTESTAYTDTDGVVRVSFSGHLYNNGGADLDLAAYNEKKGGGDYVLITEEQLDSLQKDHEQGRTTLPSRIDEDKFFEYLNVLPPCRWEHIAGFEVFHVSERITGNLVSWYAKRRDLCVTWDASCSLSRKELADILCNISEENL